MRKKGYRTTAVQLPSPTLDEAPVILFPMSVGLCYSKVPGFFLNGYLDTNQSIKDFSPNFMGEFSRVPKVNLLNVGGFPFRPHPQEFLM